jgi:UDP-N-acetyl-D-glucosamine dehydrogenase
MSVDGRGSLKSADMTDEALKNCDCAVIVTDHSDLDYGRVLTLAPLVVDTRNVTRKLGLAEYEQKVVRL